YQRGHRFDQRERATALVDGGDGLRPGDSTAYVEPLSIADNVTGFGHDPDRGATDHFHRGVTDQRMLVDVQRPTEVVESDFVPSVDVDGLEPGAQVRPSIQAH